MIIGLVPNECVHVAAKIEALEDLGFFFFFLDHCYIIMIFLRNR